MVPVSTTTAVRATLVAVAVGATAAALAMAVLSHAHAAPEPCKPNAAVIADKRIATPLRLTSPSHLTIEVTAGNDAHRLRKPTGTAGEPRFTPVRHTEVEPAGAADYAAPEDSRPILRGRGIGSPGAASSVIDGVAKVTEAIELAVGSLLRPSADDEPAESCSATRTFRRNPVPGTHRPTRKAAPNIAPVQHSPTPTAMQESPPLGERRAPSRPATSRSTSPVRKNPQSAPA